ncbi:hypothetical protein GIB67_028348, partial [Kingdonia uniflora]
AKSVRTVSRSISFFNNCSFRAQILYFISDISSFNALIWYSANSASCREPDAAFSFNSASSLVSWFKAKYMLKIVVVLSSTCLLASSIFIESFTLSSNRSSYWEIKASYSSAYSALYKRVCSSLSLATSSSFCITVSRDSQHQYLIGK